MPTTSRAAILALGGAVLLLALMSAGCARRGQAADAGSTPSSVSTSVAAEVTPPTTLGPTVSAPAATPVPTPDLSAVDGLIKDIDTEAGADASAGADEGTTP